VKACTGCGRLYPEDSGFCPVDGRALEDADDVPVPPDGSDTRIGETICDRYHIRRVVADGGTGRVYEALDGLAERSVAVKVLHPEVAGDTIALERFKREFAVSAQLPHEHIVEVLDFQPTEDDSFALVMEFLYGEELRATLKRIRFIKPSRLIRMMSQVAIGLDEAHARNFVHRDLKPENLFLCQTSDGDIVKVLDFGSVKDTGEGAKKLTVVGTTIGSPFYMSPEQAQGLDTLDHRADVWALSTIAYECLTGTVPFQGTNGPSILLAIVTAEPTPPSELTRGGRNPVPPSVDRALAMALRKSAPARTKNAGAFADSLGHAFGLQGTHQDWAQTSEEELTRRVDEALPRLLAESRPPPRSALAAEIDDDLGVDSLVATAESLAADRLGQAFEEFSPDANVQGVAAEVAEGRGSPAWLIPVVVVVALIAGILLAMLVR
jgi:serine/threonine protein kinase